MTAILTQQQDIWLGQQQTTECHASALTLHDDGKEQHAQ
jgi:hypothetical protein